MNFKVYYREKTEGDYHHCDCLESEGDVVSCVVCGVKESLRR